MVGLSFILEDGCLAMWPLAFTIPALSYMEAKQSNYVTNKK
jgi:hypothetical protein